MSILQPIPCPLRSTAPQAPADPHLTHPSMLLSGLLGYRMFPLEARVEIPVPLKSVIPNAAFWLADFTVQRKHFSLFGWGRATSEGDQ